MVLVLRIAKEIQQLLVNTKEAKAKHPKLMEDGCHLEIDLTVIILLYLMIEIKVTISLNQLTHLLRTKWRVKNRKERGKNQMNNSKTKTIS